jgi:hypothetical protein
VIELLQLRALRRAAESLYHRIGLRDRTGDDLTHRLVAAVLGSNM